MKSLQNRLILLTTALLALAAIFVSIRAAQHFEGSLTAQALAVEREIGRSVIEVIQKALDHDVPFDSLVGALQYLEAVKRDNPGVEYLIVAATDGRLAYSTNLSKIENVSLLQQSIAASDHQEPASRIGKYYDTATPIKHKNRTVGWLHLGERANIVAQLLRDIGLDILTVLVVASLVAFELVRLLLAASFSTPLRAMHDFLLGIAAGDFRRYLGRDFFGGIGRLNARINSVVTELNDRARREQHAGRQLPNDFLFDLGSERRTLHVNPLDNIRWPFFLLIFAESLSLSFFPIFVGQFYDPSLGWPKHVVIGLPITVFMLVWAIAMPIAGTWCDRVGYRQAFCFGAAATTVGLILTAYASSMTELLLWRSVTAVGYGTVYVTTQTYISVHTSQSERTRGMALFIASFFAGSLCGASIGGILVDRLGYEQTFLLSAALSATAALYVLRFLPAGAGRTLAKKGLPLGDMKQLLRHKYFALITFLSAIPSKIALAGFLYYSVPLYLKGLGHTQSSTGRVMMVYGIAIILLAPVAAKLADRLHNRWRFVMIGGFAASLAMAAPLFLEDFIGVTIAVFGLGIAHAVGVSSQLTLIGDRCEEVVQKVGQATTVGIFRLVERVGTVTGPVLLGVLIGSFDFKGAFLGIALFTFAATIAFTLLLLRFDRRPDEPQAT